MKRRFIKYRDCLDYLFSLERRGIKYTLKNIKSLLKAVGNPEKGFKSIHIAGTNGKGTVASIINSYQIESGLKTGLYTSPHIRDFRERILINGKMVPKEYILNFTNKYFDIIEKISPSFFEAATALAFKYFKDKKVDYAVIEAGLGGRLDSTNVIKPEISIITTIAKEHTELLGNTIEKIAREKAGIIKPRVPVVTGNLHGKAAKVIRKIAERNRCEIYETNSEKFLIPKYLERQNWGLGGNFQEANIKTAVTALINLYGHIDFSVFRIGLTNLRKNSHFYGRFDIVKKEPLTIIDVSHNREGIKNLNSSLKQFKYNKVIAVMSMMSDKEHSGCMREIEKFADKIILTGIKYKRAATPEFLFSKAGDKEKYFVVKDTKEAVKLSEKLATTKDTILYTGSFFLAAEIYKTLKI